MTYYSVYLIPAALGRLFGTWPRPLYDLNLLKVDVAGRWQSLTPHTTLSYRHVDVCICLNHHRLRLVVGHLLGGAIFRCIFGAFIVWGLFCPFLRLHHFMSSFLQNGLIWKPLWLLSAL